MKRLWIATALSAALTPIMAEVALSVPVPPSSDFPAVSNPSVDEPVCYLRTTSGTTLDLVSLCGRDTATIAPGNPAPGNNGPGNNPNVGAPGNNGGRGTVTRDTLSTPTSTPANTSNPSSPTVEPTVPTASSGETPSADGADPASTPGIDLPRVPPSAFGPGGTAPTRDSINGPNR